MSSALASATLDPGRSVVEQLRERITTLERGPAAAPVATLPGLTDLVPLRGGAAYGTDSATLALALAAGPSRAGEWVGFAGWTDFGAEAAAELGIELARTVLVPEPGEHWLEVTAALVDVLRVVVLRPPATVDAKTAGVLASRLRRRSSVLVVQGPWPRVEARLSVDESRWRGPMAGGGQLEERRTRVSVQRRGGTMLHADLTWPGAVRLDAQVLPEPHRALG